MQTGDVGSTDVQRRDKQPTIETEIESTPAFR